MNEIVPLLGIETEYGIIREDQEESDPVEESMLLLGRCEAKSSFRTWAYSRERTHLDMRGFQVSRLAQDEEEDEFCEQDRQRPYSYWEMKSDRVLTNGARFYNDHTHPEYSTPECRTVFDLVAHDLAGEHIVGECVRLRNRDLGGDALQLFKNNTDYSGHSYGTHDNYLIPRQLEFDTWVRHLVPFLVTRQLYAGAGKVGAERKNEDGFAGLQLSQRADFIDSVLSIETMTQRPIINTRDEPHATDEYRRLHLILGDANMSPYATALKVGATRLVLTLIGAGKLDTLFELEDPVADVQRVSRDTAGKVALQLKSGKTATPLEIQEWYLEQALRHTGLSGDTEEWNWVTREWGRTLNDHRNHPENLVDRIDWAIKQSLFNDFIESEGLDWEDPMLQSLDLEYHNLNPERGLYYGLRDEGSVAGLIDPQEVAAAVDRAPQDTRARIRGQAVEQELDRIKNIHWTGIEFDNGEYVDLSDIITREDVDQVLNSNKEQFAWK
jgi:proteasome accessory factor A